MSRVSKIIWSKGPHTLKGAINSKVYARIGDALVNLAAAIAVGAFEMSAVLHNKVDNKFLRQVARLSKLNEVLSGRMDTHDIGNAVEALMAFGWLSNYISLEDIVESLSSPGKEAVKMAQLADKILEEASKAFESKKRDKDFGY